jgi:RNA polymerase sigma-70 factor (ECF subfamily)
MSGEAASEDVLRALADPRDDFANLCRTLQPRLVGVLALRCGDRALAEDLAQEALARAWRDWPTVSTRRPVEPWVYATAFNLLRSWGRRLGVARRRAPALRVVAVEPDTASAVAVRAAVAALPHRQREAIALRYYADLSVADAAEAMRCAQGTVRALTAQAVASLRASLGQDIDLPEEEVQS